MATTPTEDEGDEEDEGLAGRADWTLAYALAAAVGVVSILALATAPVAALLGESRYAIPSALHGVAASVYLIVGTVSAYLAWLIYSGRLAAYRDLRVLAALNAFFSLVTILLGNWIYAYYRESGGPRAYFLEANPAVHEIFFEFKEFVALFTLPLSAAAAFILWTRRRGLAGERELREGVAAMLLLAWAFLMLAFGLGAAITKLRSV